MLKHLITNFLLAISTAFVFVFQVYPQVPLQLRYTFSIGGVSRTTTTDGKRISVSQSIGQSSVIGVYKTSAFQLRQGFIQPVKQSQSYPKARDLEAVIYPNPFLNCITVSFDEVTGQRLIINLYNLKGIVVYSEEFAVSQKIILCPGAIPSGLYIMEVFMNQRQYKWKIVRK